MSHGIRSACYRWKVTGTPRHSGYNEQIFRYEILRRDKSRHICVELSALLCHRFSKWTVVCQGIIPANLLVVNLLVKIYKVARGGARKILCRARAANSQTPRT